MDLKCKEMLSDRISKGLSFLFYFKNQLATVEYMFSVLSTLPATDDRLVASTFKFQALLLRLLAIRLGNRILVENCHDISCNIQLLHGHGCFAFVVRSLTVSTTHPQWKVADYRPSQYVDSQISPLNLSNFMQ